MSFLNPPHTELTVRVFLSEDSVKIPNIDLFKLTKNWSEENKRTLFFHHWRLEV